MCIHTLLIELKYYYEYKKKEGLQEELSQFFNLNGGKYKKVIPTFSEQDQSLNRKSYQRSNRDRTSDVINIYFIILYIIKN